MDFDRRVDFRGVIRFSPELSGDIAGAVREIRLLFNKNNELEIPFTLSGKMPNVRPRPDASYLTKALQRGLFQRGAEELQEQLFGGKERHAPDDRQQDERRQRGKAHRKIDSQRTRRVVWPAEAIMITRDHVFCSPIERLFTDHSEK